jgi:hypothetical protein
MKEQFDNTVVNDATTKKKYVAPEIEVIPIEVQAPLLSASGRYTPNFADDDDTESW